MATVSLQMIIKDEYEKVAQLLAAAVQAACFSEINLTVSDKPTANKLRKLGANTPGFNVKWREWNNRFDEARNANFAMCKSDYAFWVDADDTFDFTTIPQLLQIAEENQIDALFLPYNYAQDENGICVTKQYRERLLRMASGFTWKGWIHETPIWPTTDYKSHIMDGPEVTHHMDHLEDSVERNHAILEEAYKKTDDPRYAYYYGASLFTKGEYEQSMLVLRDYLKVGGSQEDIYRALSLISEGAYHLGKFDLALEFATKAMCLKPSYPMAYWLLAQYEANQKNWPEALEWVKTSLTKEDPKTLSVWDPSARERAILIAAQAEFMLQNYNSALAWLRKIPNNETAQDLMDGFIEEADAETFINILPKIRKYFHNDHFLWEGLCRDMQYDLRLQPLRFATHKPQKWADNSIVIFCGEGFEEWGPQTLDKGMGGSEEAVVYLSRELSKLGYDVTVFGEVTEPVRDTTVEPKEYDVKYRPWKEIDKRDDFNVFIAWRAPQYLDHINAKVKLADIHDIIPKEAVKDIPDATYMFKSNYHKDLYGPVNSKVIGNGIQKEHFSEDTKNA